MPKKRAVRKRSNRNIYIGISVVVVMVGVAGTYFFFGSSITQATSPQINPADFNLPNRLGAEDAPITILEFGEYQCPNCASFYRNTKDLLVSRYVDPGIVKIYFRDFAYYGPDSTNAAIAARCAGDQGKYWDYHDVLFSTQGQINSGWANKTQLVGFAVMIDLDMPTFASCLNSGDYLSEVESDFAEGVRLGVGGTPTFVIIGPDGRQQIIVGAQPFSAFERVIESLLIG